MKNKTACTLKYCKFQFSEGKTCSFGKKCRFVHDKNILIPCPYFMDKEKKCSHGEGCWYLHLSTETDNDALLKRIVEMENEFNEKFSNLTNENLELRQRIEELESEQKSNQSSNENRITLIENKLSDKQSKRKLEMPNFHEEKAEVAMEENVALEETPFQVGELIEIYHNKFSKPDWSVGLIRNIRSEGSYDIQTLSYTFWNVPKKKVRYLGKEKLEERLKANCTLTTEKNLKQKLRRMRMKK